MATDAIDRLIESAHIKPDGTLVVFDEERYRVGLGMQLTLSYSEEHGFGAVASDCDGRAYSVLGYGNRRAAFLAAMNGYLDLINR